MSGVHAYKSTAQESTLSKTGEGERGGKTENEEDYCCYQRTTLIEPSLEEGFIYVVTPHNILY